MASIVIPLLDQRLAWLQQCVGSALVQTVPSDVIVVVSPDTPSALVDALLHWRADTQWLTVIAQQRVGFSAALNTGIAASKAERVGFLLSDDWLEPDTVKTCLAHESDIVSTGMRFWSGDGRTRFASIDRRPTQSTFDALSSTERKAAYLEHFFLFRRRALLAVGGVDEAIGLTGADDYDLIWTLLEHGASVSVLPDQLYNYRDHFEERLTLRDPVLQMRDLGRILDKHRIAGGEREEILRRHSLWFGAPVHVVQQRLMAAREAARP